MRALYQAQEDPEVTNLVIDISNNGGGESRIAFTIMSLVANDARDWRQNLITNQSGFANYDVDRNFDGVFDSRDADVSFDLNFAVLTSSFSFSSGNSLASLFHDHGIPVLGEQSHGGVNNVLALCTAEGFDYSIASGHCRETNSAGQNIEEGTPVDVSLPYSDFYNLDALSAAMSQITAQRANR